MDIGRRLIGIGEIADSGVLGAAGGILVGGQIRWIVVLSRGLNRPILGLQKRIPEERDMITEMQRAIDPEPATPAATLASCALANRYARVEPPGWKWRVRIFEYGLSRNRYRVAEKGRPLASAVAAPLRWTRRSARAALRHLDGVICFGGHAREGWCGSCSARGPVGFFSEPALGSRGPEATLTLLESHN